MTPAPYRTPTPPEAPRVRRQWVVRWSKEPPSAAEVSFVAMLVGAGFVGTLFIFGGLCPEVLRALLVWALFAAAWCAAFVRREVVS